MALDAVVGEIREKGKKEAARIRDEGREEEVKILAEANAKVEAIKMAVEEDVNRLNQHIMKQEVAAANLAVKREMLNVQKEMLDEVQERARKAITDLPSDFHRKAIRELCKTAAKELGEGVFYCNERDAGAVEEALKELKTLSGFSLAGKKDIPGGVIAESKDGQLQLDFSYNATLSEIWESGLKGASDILFG